MHSPALLGPDVLPQISWWRTTFGREEIQQVSDAIQHGHISQGAMTAEFERQIGKILGMPYVVATTSGSMALLMALLAMDIGPGDEVIIPNRAWIAAAHAPHLLGARVVLVDVESDRPVMDVHQLEARITARTKAIIPVHLNGRSVNMEAVHGIAARYGLRIIEDAAQAFCSKNVTGMLGTQSDVGCFSLSAAKLISTGQGGIVVTKHPHLYEKLKLLRTHGVNDPINVSYAQMGFNCRFTDIQAAIGLAQLTRLGNRLAEVNTIYARYASVLPDLPLLKLIPVNVPAGEVPLYVEVLCPQRDALVRFLAEHGIQARPFYPNLQLASYLGTTGQFPHSRAFETQGLFLPCGPGQPLETIDRVLHVLIDFQARA